ncbi:MAG: hypothetical protein ACKO8O_17270 [Betaproteobacteria bacterium]
MHFASEEHSGYFRRSLAALEARSAEPEQVRSRLAQLTASPLDAAAIDALFAWQTNGRPLEPDGEHAASVLRRLRQWVMLVLIERDITGRAELDEVCQAMTHLARRATGCAMSVAGFELVADFGHALDGEGQPQDLLAVAMGKGGADELNVSSDLDLVFVFRDEGQSSGGASGRTIAASEWMHRAARRTIELLSEITADGFVFRVDTRLRPNGDSGPLDTSYPQRTLVRRGDVCALRALLVGGHVGRARSIARHREPGEQHPVRFAVAAVVRAMGNRKIRRQS